jgi:hypothetical protein
MNVRLSFFILLFKKNWGWGKEKEKWSDLVIMEMGGKVVLG